VISKLNSVAGWKAQELAIQKSEKTAKPETHFN